MEINEDETRMVITRYMKVFAMFPEDGVVGDSTMTTIMMVKK